MQEVKTVTWRQELKQTMEGLLIGLFSYPFYAAQMHSPGMTLFTVG